VIVLDTNVVSELMRPRPDVRVVTWVADLSGDDLFTTSVTVAEVLCDIARLPDGARRTRIATRWEQIIADLDDRILTFDVDAARSYADIAATREAAGRPIDVPDGQIAGICRFHAAVLATRNERDFAATGIDVVNPFD